MWRTFAFTGIVLYLHWNKLWWVQSFIKEKLNPKPGRAFGYVPCISFTKHCGFSAYWNTAIRGKFWEFPARRSYFCFPGSESLKAESPFSKLRSWNKGKWEMQQRPSPAAVTHWNLSEQRWTLHQIYQNVWKNPRQSFGHGVPLSVHRGVANTEEEIVAGHLALLLITALEREKAVYVEQKNGGRSKEWWHLWWATKLVFCELKQQCSIHLKKFYIQPKFLRFRVFIYVCVCMVRIYM